jgi:hypothetical protein
MRGMPRARAIATLTATLLAWTAAGASAQTAHQPAAPHPYRLGTAARPLGWSTAIGDLNADGRPDFAIADRLGRLDGLFAYSLELSISGIGSRWVTFNEPDPSLAIALLDVDQDHDLDVVVSAPISRKVLRIWLNDGRGAFHEAPSPPAASTAEVGRDEADTTTRRGPDVAAATISSQRDLPSLDAASISTADLAGHGRPSANLVQAPRRLHASRLRSRAPPRL